MMLTIRQNALIGALAYALVSVSCHKNSAVPLSVVAMNPDRGADSTTVTMVGTGFSATAADDIVSFNGKQATLVSANTNTLVALVPTLAGTGNVTITVNGKTVSAGAFTFDTTWRVTMIANNLLFPQYISIDGGGNFYVPTIGNELINKITPQGVISTFLPLPDVTGTAIDAAGNLYVVSNITGDSTDFYKISPGGILSHIATDSGYIYGIALDANGDLYAANSSKNTIDKITPQGVVSVLASGLYVVSGVAVGSDGTVYASNYSKPGYTPANGVVTKISPSGTVSTLAANVLYSGENGITIDGDNNLYVTVFDQGRVVGYVVKITPDGTVTPLQVSNSSPSLLFEEVGITRDNNGNLYVANAVNTAGGTIGSVVKMTPH